MVRGEPPPFYELDEYVFQRLCNELLDAEPDVMSSNEYGIRGQTQYGIDLLAPLHEGLTCYAVAQCKCYAEFPPAKIKEASDEFFKHQDHWATWQIRRFILMVACDMRTTQRQHAIKTERERFAQAGIRYEVWDATQLLLKLGPRRDIVERYLGPAWVSDICGTTSGPLAGRVLYPRASFAVAGSVAGSGAADVLVQYLAQLTPSLSREHDEQLASMRRAYREGRKDEAQRRLATVLAAPEWTLVEPVVKAQILRFAAAVQFDFHHDPVEATRLVEEAAQLDPAGNNRRIHAFIAARTEGIPAALTLLADDQDPESRNVHAALLLEQGDADAARAILHSLQERQQADAETLRLLALVHLLKHEVDQAQLAIQKAQEVAPQWVAIRLVAAIVDYWSTVAPVALPDTLVPWPQPVDWAFIKHDDLSLSRLRRAARSFLDLATSPYPPDSRENLQTWHLACLANDPEHQEEAVAACERMLRANPADYRAVIWAMNRRFRMDWQQVERALNECITKRQAEAAHVQVLASWYLATDRATKARLLLERTQKLFTAVGAEDAWEVWHQQATVLAATPKQVARLVADPTAVKRTPYATALERQAAEDGNLEPLIAYYDQCYAATDDPLWLFQACEALATAEQWERLAERVPDLLARIPTSTVLHLAVLGLYNTGDHPGCLALLEQHRAWFPQGRFPAQLRRIRITCQRRVGILAHAIAEAEALYQEEPTTSHLLTLCRAYLDVGDVPAFALKSRRLLQHPDLPATEGLQVARLVAPTDRHLAIDLWRMITRNPLADDLISPAINLGFQLGLETDLRPLMAHLPRLVDTRRGGIQQVTISDVQELMQRRHQFFAELETQYWSGQAPLHVIAGLRQWPLPDLYHRVLSVNAAAPDPLHQFSLLIRHGTRTSPLVWNHADRRPRLYLDVTALLLAAHLELLEVIEQVFAPLFIPIDLIAALVQMWTDMDAHQPSTVVGAQRILRLVEQGMIQVLDVQSDSDSRPVPALDASWNALFEAAQEREAYLVDYLPKHLPTDLDQLIVLPDEMAAAVVNCRTLIEALRQQGPFSEQHYLAARDALGTEGVAEPCSILPPLSAALLLVGTIPETLTAADLLSTIATHFRVWIEGDELRRLQALVQGDQERRALQDWLSQVLAHVRQGLDTNRYQVIAQPPEIEREERQDAPFSLEVRCLFTLLLTPLQTGDVVWIDDRAVTGQVQRAGVPVAGVVEILAWLHQQQAMNDTLYYDKLLHLRAANLRFIPLSRQELAYHLTQAHVEDGVLLETDALQIVRRSIAACLYQDDLLQPPTADHQGHVSLGELPFVMETTRTIREALFHTWVSTPDPTIRHARVEWVYTHLYIMMLGTRDIIKRVASPDQCRYGASLELLQLLLVSATEVAPGITVEQTQAYCQWITERVIHPWCQADPLLPAAMAERYKHLLRETLIEAAPDDRSTTQEYAQLIFSLLPEIVQEELSRDTTFMASLGLAPVFAAGTLTLALPDVLNAIPAILADEVVVLPLLGSARKVQLRLKDTSDQQTVICIDDPETGESISIANPAFRLAHRSLREREAVLRCHYMKFDRPVDLVEQLIAHLATLDDITHRISDVTDRWDRSMPVFYSRLHQKVQHERAVTYAQLLPPVVEEILWHLRIDPATPSEEVFMERMAVAAEGLITERGPCAAWERLASVPIPLPQVVIDAFTSLSVDDQRTALRKLLQLAHSPISLLQLIHLVLQLQFPLPVAHRLARRLTMHLLSPAGVAHMEAFLALLRWVGNALTERQDVRAWPVAWRLTATWSHAHHLYQVLLSVPLLPAGIQQIFTDQHQNVGPRIFEPQRAYEQDRAHAAGVVPSTLVLDGLTYALGDLATSVLTAEVQQRLADLAFPERAGQRLPDPALLIITPGITSPFPSFLGSDRIPLIRLLVEEDLAACVSREELITGVMQICERLRDNPQDHGAWEAVQVTLGDRQPDPSLQELLDEVIAQTNFAAWAAADRSASLAGLRTATLQAPYLSSPARQHLKDMIVACVRVLAQPGDQESPDHPAIIVRAIHNLSVAESTPADAIRLFTEIMTQVIEVWPQVAAAYRPLVQRIWEVLPSDQSYQLWPLVLRLRAA